LKEVNVNEKTSNSSVLKFWVKK